MQLTPAPGYPRDLVDLLTRALTLGDAASSCASLDDLEAAVHLISERPPPPGFFGSAQL